jgi:hypothetical protein
VIISNGAIWHGHTANNTREQRRSIQGGGPGPIEKSKSAFNRKERSVGDASVCVRTFCRPCVTRVFLVTLPSAYALGYLYALLRS